MVLRAEQGVPHGACFAPVGALLALRASLAVGIALVSGCAVPATTTPAHDTLAPLPSVSSVAISDAAAPLEAIVDASVEDADASVVEAPIAKQDHAVDLFDDAMERATAIRGCSTREGDENVRCLLDARFHDDASRGLANEMWTRWGSLAGVLPEQEMDGGYRGTLHLVPVVPEGAEKRHLAWVRASLADYEAFFAKLVEGREGKPRYRARDIRFHFFRSVHAHTPAAFAVDWSVAYNVAGSLNVTATSVRETLFHEIFHLNDQEHGDWSPGALSEVFDAVVAKCGTKIDCLKPFAPSDTIVRGGTYYAFQPGNGVREYAAELAIRYYREQRAALGLEAFGRKPFKCSGELDAKAWKAIVDEFFAGIDRSPACR